MISAAKLLLAGDSASRQAGLAGLRAGFRFIACRLPVVALVLMTAAGTAWGQAQRRTSVVFPAPSDEQSYNKEFVFGINFNTQAGLLGGASIRSSRVLDDRTLRFWMLEGVMLKNAKEQRVTNQYVGGSYIASKTNYGFVLRPSFGLQRVLFRKAADAGVQVNVLASAGPSLGLLMPYYISYDRTKHNVELAILDHGPLFSGIGQTQVVPGAHLRGALSFEYGRYRDAVAGLEVGFVVEAFTRRMVMLSPDPNLATDQLNRQFFPSVYLTLYFGHRS